MEDIFLYYRTVEDIEKGIDEALLKYNREKFGELVLDFDTDRSNNENYLRRLKNAINFKMSIIEQQIRSYTYQKGVASQLIDKINQEVKLIKEQYW